MHLQETTALVRLLKSVVTDSAASERVIAAIATEERQMAVIRAARQHGVLAPLQRALLTSAATPPALRLRMERMRQESASRYAYRLTEMARYRRLFCERSIPCVPFGGFAAAVTLYGDHACHDAETISYLLPAPAAQSALRLLMWRGFRSFAAGPGHHSLIREGDGLYMELCWDLGRGQWSAPLPWERAVPSATVRLADDTISVLAPQDAMLALCFEAEAMDWQRLEQPLLLARWCRIYKGDWQSFLARAESHGWLRVLLKGVALSAQAFDQPLPAEVDKRLRLETRLQASLAHAPVAWLRPQPGDSGFVGRELFRIRAKSRWHDRAPHYGKLIRFALTPNGRDRAWLPLPPRLERAYLLVRAARLAARYVPRLGARLKHRWLHGRAGAVSQWAMVPPPVAGSPEKGAAGDVGRSA